MDKKIIRKLKGSDRKKQGIIIGLLVLVVILTILLIAQLMKPERSVAAYCKVYSQEKTRLSTMSNNSYAYPSGVFNVTLNNAGQIATSFGRLDSVAPNEIELSVKTLQQLYQKIHDDPSQAIAASLSGGAIDDSLKAWTTQNCH